MYPKRGREGKEIRIDKEFAWGNEIWHIPAVGKRKYWILRMFFVLFTMSVSVAVLPCEIINVHAEIIYTIDREEQEPITCSAKI